MGRPRAVARGARSRAARNRFEFLARQRAGRDDRDVRADVRRAALSGARADSAAAVRFRRRPDARTADQGRRTPRHPALGYGDHPRRPDDRRRHLAVVILAKPVSALVAQAPKIGAAFVEKLHIFDRSARGARRASDRARHRRRQVHELQPGADRRSHRHHGHTGRAAVHSRGGAVLRHAVLFHPGPRRISQSTPSTGSPIARPVCARSRS